MDLDQPESKRTRSASPNADSEGTSKKPRLAQDSELVTPTLTPGEATPSTSTEDALGQNDVKTAPRRPAYETLPMPVSRLGLKPVIPDLPPSLAIVMGIQPDEMKARRGLVGQEEVGIIGYAGPKELKGVRGVIKQR
jgi:tRNA pseudouridine13 synthase